MAGTHYRHSGKVSPKVLLFAAVIVGLVGPTLALIYAAATVYIPFIYINLLLTVGFGALLGFAAAASMKAGHVRNTAVLVMATALAAAVAYYVHWVFWFGVHAWRADASFAEALVLLFPPFLFEAIGMVNDEGTWGIGSSGSAVTGTLLTIVWLAELVVFAGGVVLGAMAGAPSVYCEQCGTWCARRDGVRRYGFQFDPLGFASRLDDGDLNVLAEAPPSDPGAQQWTQLDLELCEECGHTNALILKSVRVETDSKGNTSQKDDVLVDRLLLTGDQTRWVLDGPGPASEPEQAAVGGTPAAF